MTNDEGQGARGGEKHTAKGTQVMPQVAEQPRAMPAQETRGGTQLIAQVAQPPQPQAYAQPPQPQAYAQPPQPQAYAQPPQPQAYAQPPQRYAMQPQWHRSSRGKRPLLLLTSLTFVSIAGFGLWHYRGKLGTSWLPTRSAGVTLGPALLEQTLEPSNDEFRRAAVGNELKVELPPGSLSQARRLVIRKALALPAVDGARGTHPSFDVTLEGQSKFTESVTIEMPIPADAGYGRNLRRNAVAMWWDPAGKSWNPIPYHVDEKARVMRITTDHLSIFTTVSASPVELNPAAKVKYVPYPYEPRFADQGRAETILRGGTGQATLAGWESANEWLGIGSSAGTFAEEAMGMASLGPLNEAASRLGIGFAAIQLVIDLSQGKNRDAAVNATKNLSYISIGQWGTSAMKIGSVAVFAIDYSLNKFATTAIAGRFEIWENAYRLYYKEHRRSSVDWFNRFKALAETSKDPEQVSAAMRNALDDYVQEFWNDELVVAAYQERVQSHAMTGGGGLNDGVKKQLSDNHRSEIAPTIAMVIERLQQQLQRDYEAKLYHELNGLSTQLSLKSPVRFGVKLPANTTNPPKLEGAKIRVPVSRDQNKFEGQLNAKGEWELPLTPLGYLMYGAPKEAELTLPQAAGAEPKVYKAKMVVKPGGAKVEFELDAYAGTYEVEWSQLKKIPGVKSDVRLSGPIRIVVTEQSAATGTFAAKFAYCMGSAVNVEGSASGEFAGKLEGTHLEATGPVKTQVHMKYAMKVPSGVPTDQGNSSTCRVTGDLVQTPKGPVIKGKILGHTGEKDAMPFEAPKTSP